MPSRAARTETALPSVPDAAHLLRALLSNRVCCRSSRLPRRPCGLPAASLRSDLTSCRFVAPLCIGLGPVGGMCLQDPSHKDKMEQHVPNHLVVQRHVTALEGAKSNTMECMYPYHTSKRLRGSAGSVHSSAQFPETQVNQESGTPMLEGATPIQ